MKYFFPVLSLFLALASCRSTQSLTPDEDYAFFVRQEDWVYPLNKTFANVSIDRAPFDLVFRMQPYDREGNRFHATQIALFTSQDLLKELRSGKSIEDISYFFEGTGMASDENDWYSTAFIDKENAHHYVFFEDGGRKRVHLIRAFKDGSWQVAWPVRQVSIDGMKGSIDQSPFNVLYAAILQDRNLNRIVDKGEYVKLAIKLR